MFSLAALVGPAWAQDKKDEEKSEEEEGEEGEGSEAAEGEDASKNQASSSSTLQRGNRMEFDARLIRGERASGAVFLFQRATRPLPSMVRRRTSYLDDTVTKTLGNEEADQFRKNQSEAIQKRIREEEEERRKAREASIKKAEKEKAEKERQQKQQEESDDKKKKSGK